MRGAWLALALALVSCARLPPPPPLAAAARDGLSTDDCASCHEKEHAAWLGSGHARSYSNPLFAASFAREPRPWCIGCHAPLPEQAAAHLDATGPGPAAQGLLAEGINCAACHLKRGVLISARVPTPAARAAHPIRHEPRLGSSAFCGDCHQFNFPEGSVVAMQNTVREWEASSAGRAGTQCQGCHSDHGYAGGHDAAAVARAVEISAASADGGVAITLRLRDVGHRLPTGDPFRRLRLEVCDGDDCREEAFWRRYGLTGDTVTSVRETTLLPDAPTVAWFPGVSAPRWRLVYRYAAPNTDADLKRDEIEQLISSGEHPGVSQGQGDNGQEHGRLSSNRR